MFDNRLTSTTVIFAGSIDGPLVFVKELAQDSGADENINQLWLAFDDAARKYGPKATAFIQINGNKVAEI